MIYAITVCIGVLLLGVILVCYIIAGAADYDPAWEDDWEEAAKRSRKR